MNGCSRDRFAFVNARFDRSQFLWPLDCSWSLVWFEHKTHCNFGNRNKRRCPPNQSADVLSTHWQSLSHPPVSSMYSSGSFFFLACSSGWILLIRRGHALNATSMTLTALSCVISHESLDSLEFLPRFSACSRLEIISIGRVLEYWENARAIS
ncbi:hypothetical protein BDR04DRAFT_246095 [Suillus decipiens]|nr:hypothetical protein BDR04DRAFT_246095 [Suillus decipiens]